MKVDEVSRITCPMLCLVNTGEVAERGTLSSEGVPPLVIWGKQAKRLPNEQNGTRRTRKEK